VKKVSTVAKRGNEIFNEPKLTIGLDLGDRSSHYCILDEAGNVLLEHRLPTTPKGIHQFSAGSHTVESHWKPGRTHHG
jgi:predicted NBD/HSP70 family sugar kinase